jgi:hypothetical protein
VWHSDLHPHHKQVNNCNIFHTFIAVINDILTLPNNRAVGSAIGKALAGYPNGAKVLFKVTN